MAILTKKNNTTKTPANDLSTVSGLELVAKQYNKPVPKESKGFRALDAIGRVLNFGTAVSAGALRGIKDPNKSITEGVREGVKKNISFSDVFREDFGWKPQGKLGKAALWTTSFAADVLFDPITYLTLGVGAGTKIGGKILNQAGTKVAEELTQNVLKGASKSVRRSLAGKSTGEILESSISNASAKISKRVPGDIFDKGGVKFAGRSIIGGDRIANLVGKAGSMAARTELGSAVLQTSKALKNTSGKLFVYGYGKNPILTKAFEKGSRSFEKKAEAIGNKYKEVFKDFNDDELRNFFDTIFKKKKEVIASSDSARKIAKASQKKEKLIFNNPKWQKAADRLFEGKNALVKKLAKEANIPEEEAIKYYIPSRFADRKAKEIYFSEGLGADLGFQKQFKGVEENLIRDPYKAYVSGELAVAKARIKKQTADSIVKALGKPFEEFTEEEAKRIGLELFEKKTIDGTIKSWLPKEIKKELSELFDPSKTALNTIDDLARYTGFDYVTGLFKTYVTSLFPSFYVRNMMGNQFQNLITITFDSVDTKLNMQAIDILRGKNLDAKLTLKNGQKLSNREIIDLVKKETDILSKGAYSGIENMIEEGANVASRKLNLNPLSRENAVFKALQRAGTKTEQQAKLVNILSGLRGGKSITEAISTAEEALFNYSKLTPFEKSIMRRLIPFYTFARKNFELQLKTLMTNPGRIAAEIKGFNNASGAIGEGLSEEDKEGLPSWIINSLGIKAGANQYGQNQFFTGFGLPIEEFLQRFSGEKGIVWNAITNTLSQTNPIIKFPIERATGTDIFRQKPIAELTNAEDLVSMLNSMPKPVSDQLKSLIEFNEIKNQPVYVNGVQTGARSKYTANPMALHFLRILPTARLQSTVGFMSADDQTPLSKALRLFTGIKAYSIDQEEQKFFNELKRKKELEDYLIRMGVLKRFNRTYIPKDKKQDKKNTVKSIYEK